MSTGPAKKHSLCAVSIDAPESSVDERRPRRVAQLPPACMSCSGTGWEFVIDKGVRPCHCRTEQRRAKLLADAHIPELYSESTLQNYQPSKGNLSHLRAFNYAHGLVRDYPIVDRGILFMGSVGVGKTHLSVGILRGLIEKGISCRFYEYRSLLKEIQNSYNPNTNTTEMSILAPLFEYEVIVLDEIGAARPSEWVQDTIALIINGRYNEKKLTILTTNYLDERQLSAGETLGDRIGVRLRSRLYQMCKTVIVEGEDYRQNLDTRQI
ncbi:MAG TPA: ATP-binding protein [Blastocatellia bacterium]|jgi:DNA replication protein DnaC|nr:ATP-binding protein [Blastocatellia bacterium]